jgi:glycosyltransferase involved in cell wall biosynthesis
MRVLHLAAGNMFGGIETFLVTLARLEKRSSGLENHFLLGHRGRLSNELNGAGVSPLFIEQVRIRHPWSVLRARRECRALVRQLKPDVVMAHGLWTYVVFGHGLPADQSLVLFQHGIAKRDAWHRFAALRRPAGVITASAQTASTTSALFPGTRVFTCPLPVLLRAPASSRQEVRKGLGAGSEPIILMVGRFEPGKGHRLLLEALSHLAERRWRLWIAGGSSRPSEIKFRLDLEAQARASNIHNRIEFLGERTDIEELLNAADLFCQPSIVQEGFGLALAEAMGAGLPLVVTRPAATADPVGPDVGRCVAPTPAELTSALGELIDDEPKRRSLGAAARSRFTAKFDAMTALECLRDALETLADVRSAPRQLWA